MRRACKNAGLDAGLNGELDAGLVAVFGSRVKPTLVLGPVPVPPCKLAFAIAGPAPVPPVSAEAIVVGVVVGEAADEIDDGAPSLGVGNAHEGLVELEAVTAAQKLHDGVLGRLF
jgi:hypothetical protein